MLESGVMFYNRHCRSLRIELKILGYEPISGPPQPVKLLDYIKLFIIVKIDK